MNNICKNCANIEICGNSGVTDCEHYDISYTRSEILDMLSKADEKRKVSLLGAIANVYRIKLAY